MRGYRMGHYLTLKLETQVSLCGIILKMNS